MHAQRLCKFKLSNRNFTHSKMIFEIRCCSKNRTKYMNTLGG